MANDWLPGRRVVVTGGRGFIGRHVVKALAAVGADPISIVQPGVKTLDDPPGRVAVADLEDIAAARAVIDGYDAVIHLAARSGGIQFQLSPDPDVFSANRRITDGVLEASRQCGVERVFIASSLVVYRTSLAALDERDDVLGPADAPSAYAWSKITDEVVAGWYPDLHTVIGRFGNVYGPGGVFDADRATVVHALIDRAARLDHGGELVVWGDGRAVRSFIFVEDLARAVVATLAHGDPGGIYNVDTGIPTTIGELAVAVRDVVDPTLRLRFDPTMPAGFPYRVPKVGALASLGFAPAVNLREGIQATYDWYRRSSFGRGQSASA